MRSQNQEGAVPKDILEDVEGSNFAAHCLHDLQVAALEGLDSCRRAIIISLRSFPVCFLRRFSLHLRRSSKGARLSGSLGTLGPMPSSVLLGNSPMSPLR